MPHTDKEQINITLTKEQKDRWEKKLEETNEHQYMTQFIRFCVERQLASEGDEGKASTELERGVKEVKDRTTDIQESLQSIDEGVEEVKESISEPSVFEEELSTSIISVVPTQQQLENTQKSAVSSGSEDPKVVGNPPYVQTGQPRHIAEHLNQETYRVQDTLKQMEEELSFIEGSVQNGEVCYYKTH